MTSARKGALFLTAAAALSVASSTAIGLAVDLPTSRPLMLAFWMSGFVFLCVNLSYFVVTLVVWAVMREEPLPEAVLVALPRTALLYVVREEPVHVVAENLSYSLRHNAVDGLDAWLLSNSEREATLAGESDALATLQRRFGSRRVRYHRALRNPLRRKHVCVREWLDHHPEYAYVVICDADSRLPPESVWRLVAKAEHPDNTDVALLQSHVGIDDHPTHFVRILGLTQELCQQIYASVHQRIFGRCVSYGSGHLVRASALADIQVPDWVLSHDIWDTVSLEARGGRVAFCGDVRTLGSFPVDYVEYLGRSRRWILGTLESTALCLRAPVPLGTRFMTLYPAYMYVFQPIFAVWITAGVLCDERLWRSLFAAQQFAVLGASAIDLEMGSHLALTLAIALVKRTVRFTGLRGAARAVADVAASVLFCLTSLLFDSLAVLEFLLVRGTGRPWTATKKGDPGPLPLGNVVKALWPAAVAGIAGLAIGVLHAPRWGLVVAPFLGAFVLSIPLAYWTAKGSAGGRAHRT